MARILVIRLSALGDVAISVPLVKALAEQYPEHEFIMISQAQMAGLFEDCPSNVQLISAELNGAHKGIWGMYKLYREIGAKNVDVICDMHYVIRTRIFSFFFKLHRIPVFCIDKERSERKKLTRRYQKHFKQLKTSFERYREVFARAGLSLNYFDFWPKMNPSAENLPIVEAVYGPKQTKWLGFAPFARHEGKIYPINLSEQVLAKLVADPRLTLFLFGGGIEEKNLMNQWKAKYPALIIPSARNIQDEIKLMSCLDLMVAMDSANMHLGSLAHTPVVSIWGATHPYAGFYGLFQSERNIIQSNLECRPCSVFGNKPCFRGDYACMNQISPETVIQHIQKEIGL
ncbi:MAG TPA: glycosyltransferase family 9 protein [Bacteroidales bacterium]|nr:glycosyltransferase family 9 protein [Bacteroidales bacterium]